MSTTHAESVILACCVLHNFLRTKTLESYTPTNFADALEPNGNVVDGSWRQDGGGLPGIRRTHNRNPTQAAVEVRDELIAYFDTVGRVDWQDAHVRRT